MIDKICLQLSESIDDLYIQKIIKTDKMYLVSLSDKYGNDMDMLPLGFDCVNGMEVHVDYDFDSSGIYCDIPEQYDTYRNIVFRRLSEYVSEDVINDLGPYGIVYAINAIYTEYVSNVSISQLFAICNYLIHTIALVCDNNEKTKFMLLLSNDTIGGFIRMAKEDKLLLVDEYYFIPEYLQETISLSDELLYLAKEKYKGNIIDENQCHLLIEKIKRSIDDSREKLSIENDLAYDSEKMETLLNSIISNFEIEFKYCIDISTDISERMRETVEDISFGNRGSFTSHRVTFGNEEE
ncbi:MAG: hypothetical protein GYA02_03375 [Clostridiaceae bacterium]|nr:hypothetical protein [Clostridiaceae bacterium]